MSKRKCSKCEKAKDITAFYTRKGSRDGYHTQCKSCLSLRNKENHKKRVAQSAINNDPDYQKKCSMCGITQLSTNFYTHLGYPDGYSTACKQCTLLQQEESRQRRIQRHANITHSTSAITSKQCTTCKSTFLLSEFSVNKSTADGFSLHCRKCSSIKDRRSRESNKIRNTANPIIIGNKTCYDCKQELSIDRFGIRLNLSDGHCNVCKDCESVKDHKRRELRASPSDSEECVTGPMLIALKTIYRNRCAYCNCCPKVLHIDHVLPIALGGLTIRSNLLPACHHCNLSKHKKSPEEWFTKIGRKFEFDGNWLMPVGIIVLVSEAV